MFAPWLHRIHGHPTFTIKEGMVVLSNMTAQKQLPGKPKLLKKIDCYLCMDPSNRAGIVKQKYQF